MNFARNLAKQGLVQHAECADVASFVLKESGLPELRATSPVRGERLDFDRRNERARPPHFNDGIVKPGKSPGAPSITVQISAQVVGKFWDLRLTRKSRETAGARRSVESSTVFHFLQGARLSRPSCELSSITFEGSAPIKYSEELNAQSCIALLDIDEDDKVAWSSQAEFTAWETEDCAFGVHYFTAIKEELLKDAKKKRMH